MELQGRFCFFNHWMICVLLGTVELEAKKCVYYDLSLLDFC